MSNKAINISAMRAGFKHFSHKFNTDIHVMHTLFNSSQSTLEKHSKKFLTENGEKLLKILLAYFSYDDIMFIDQIGSLKVTRLRIPKFAQLTQDIQISEKTFHKVIVFAKAESSITLAQYKMNITHLCTLINECLSQFIKIIALQDITIFKDTVTRVSLSEILYLENEREKEEYFIDNILNYDKNLSNFVEKAKFLLKVCKAKEKYNYSLLQKLKVERDCIVHHDSKYDKKSIELLKLEAAPNTHIPFSIEKMNGYFKESKQIIDFIKSQVIAYYEK